MRKGNINNNINPKGVETTDVEVIKTFENSRQPIIENTNSIESIDTQSEVIKDKSKDKTKTIILILVIILALLVTAGLLVYKYIEKNKYDINGSGTELPNVENDVKLESADAKYLVEYDDMYTVNPITIVEKDYTDGTIKVDGETVKQKSISYIQISGLKNKEIQNKINEELKTSAFDLSETITSKQKYSSYSYVVGNFSNILSVNISIYIYENNDMVKEKEIYLNYNLATGEKIKFLDLFADNTPMNSIIYDIKYEALAWDTEINFDSSEEEWDKATNMDRRDTSEYEDIILRAINKYKNLDKDSIQFYISPNRLTVKLAINDDGSEGIYSIFLYKYRDYITAYKKFQTNEDIYQVKQKQQFLVFNYMHDFVPRYYKKEYDNLFISIFSSQDGEYGEEQDREYTNKYGKTVVNKKNELIQKNIDNVISQVKKLANKNKNNKGYMARYSLYWDIGEYSNGYGEENFICISIYGDLSEMDIDYYNENAFRLLAKNNVRSIASVDDLFTGYLDYKNKNIKSLQNKEERALYSADLYYDFKGNLIADSYDNMQEYLDSKYK